jgi:hypothetical protein
MRKAIILGLIIIAGTAAAFGNIKVKSKQTMGGQSYENTTYIKGKRQRAETMSGAMVNITQCDLRRAIQLNPATKTFVVNEFGEITPSGNTTQAKGVSQPVVKGGKIISTITIKDTGERKQMFGYTARHLIITMDTDSTPEACSKTKSKMQTDGWYIDFDFAFDCDQQYSYQARPQVKNGGCQDKFEMKTIGTAKRGFAVYEKMTFFDESGKETMSMVNEVVELSKIILDAALFDVPADYRQVEDMSQMYASASSMSSASGVSSSPSSSPSSSTMSLPKSNSSVSSEPLNAKKPGTIRIGIASVKTGAVGEGITANDLAAAVQNSFADYLKVPNVEVVQLETKLTSAIDAEAQQKECDFVIYANVSHKKGGGGFGMFGKALGSAIGQTGFGHTGSTAGNVAGNVAARTISSASMDSQVKAKDEITLDIKLTRTGGASALAKVYKAKAKSNGDDIISQVIEQAATNIVETVGK